MTPGQKVTTPNGQGTYEGDMWEGAIKHIMVRHTIAKMTSDNHGVCLTPTARISGLWMYEEREIEL